jgi:DNA-binding FadR family transcriptional regulator
MTERPSSRWRCAADGSTDHWRILFLGKPVAEGLREWFNDRMTPTRRHQPPMRDLLRQIVRGEYAPGDKLPKELDLAEQYGISRGVARESIRGLEERRVVEVRHGRGQMVTDPEQWDVFDGEVLAALLDSDGEALIREVLEAQKFFEIEAAALAARRAGPEHLTALTETLDAMAASAALAPISDVAAARYRVDRLTFHRRLVRAAGNRALAGMIEPLYSALATAGMQPITREDLDAEIAECRLIVAAIADGDDSAAMETVDEHLTAFARRLLGD